MVEVANPCMSLPSHVLGCDVGKDKVVIFDSITGVIAEVCNTQKALAGALAECGMESHSLIVCEATGGFEAPLLAAAAAARAPATTRAHSALRHRRRLFPNEGRRALPLDRRPLWRSAPASLSFQRPQRRPARSNHTKARPPSYDTAGSAACRAMPRGVPS